MIRCADAAGADGVVLAGHSVDAYNPKTVRASVGSLFHLPLAIEPDPAAAVRAAQAAGLQVLAADGAGEVDLDARRRAAGRARPPGCSATRPGACPPSWPRWPTTGSGSRSTAAPRASTSPPPPRCASTPRRGLSAAEPAARRRVTRRAASRRSTLLADGVVLADGAGVVTALNAVGRVLARRRPRPTRSACRSTRCSRSRTTTAATGARTTARTAACRPAPPCPSRPGCCPTAPRCSSSRGSTAPPSTEPVARVAVSLRSGRGRARLDRERSDLVATVAHELRSPLTGVKGFVQALLNRWDKLNDDQKKLMLTTVSADSDRLSRLIAELLDVARIDTGRLQLYPRPSDAAVLVRRVVDSVDAGTSRPIELEVADGLPEITVDPDKFTQVVTNLVENAVRHGEGAVRVSVDRRRTTGVRVRVEDEGEGISPEMRRRVFTKFWTGGGRGGSGLGLYLVNGLVKAHGGTVSDRRRRRWRRPDRRRAAGHGGLRPARADAARRSGNRFAATTTPAFLDLPSLHARCARALERQTCRDRTPITTLWRSPR